MSAAVEHFIRKIALNEGARQCEVRTCDEEAVVLCGYRECPHGEYRGEFCCKFHASNFAHNNKVQMPRHL